MPELREALAELAELARPYGDAQAAIQKAAAARRRRQILIPGSALAVVVTLVVAIAGPLARRGEPYQPAEPSAPAEHTFPYPKEPVTLDPDAPPLPSDGPVGAASFVWARSAPTALHIVLPAGRQFQIPLDPVTGEGDGRSAYLSPNGQVLIWRTADGARLRDLTSTRQAELPARGYSLWSPNSRWVVGWNGGGDAVRLDVETLDEVALPRLANLFGLLDTGELLVVDGDPGGEKVQFSVLDPVTGTKKRSFVVDARPHLVGSESVYIPIPDSAPRVLASLWTAGGEVGLIRIDRIDDGTNPGASFSGESATGLLVFSTTDGRVLRRIDRTLSEQEHTPGRYSGWPGPLSWNPVDGNQVVLLEDASAGCTITLIDIASGEHVEVARVACDLGGPIAVRGGTALL